MSTTNLDQVAGTANIKMVTSLPQTPQAYYSGSGAGVSNTEWVGGEQVILTYGGVSRHYVQTATSGTSPTWRHFSTILANTTTTSTSTSTSSTTSSSTSSTSTTTGA